MKRKLIFTLMLSTGILSGCNGFSKFSKNAQAPYSINHILISSEIDPSNNPVDLLDIQRQLYLSAYKEAISAENPHLNISLTSSKADKPQTKPRDPKGDPKGDPISNAQIILEEKAIESKTDEQAKIQANNSLFLNGTQYAHLLCGKYMKELNASIANRRYASQQVDIVGGAISAALGIADVSSKIVGGSALGFSSLNSSMKAYENAYVLSPDIEQVETLVREKMYEVKMKYYLDKKPSDKDKKPSDKDKMTVKQLKDFDSVFEVMEALDEYSHQCSLTGMKGLIKTAINEKIIKTAEDANKPDSVKAEENKAAAHAAVAVAQAAAKATEQQ